MSKKNIRNVKNQINIQEWSLQVQEQQESGLSVAAWCRTKGIKPSTFFHRLKRVRNTVLDNMTLPETLKPFPITSPTFSEIDVTQMQEFKPKKASVEPLITVNLNDATVTIPNNSSL